MEGLSKASTGIPRFVDFGARLTDDVILDGTCLFRAVRLIAHRMGVDEAHMKHVPLPAGESCPSYTLPTGDGFKPRFRYEAGTLCWNVLQCLLDLASENASDVFCFCMGFTDDGQFYFQLDMSKIKDKN